MATVVSVPVAVAARLGCHADEEASLYLRALQDGPVLQLGGNVHDYLVLLTCSLHGTGLATLDQRQAALADHVDGLTVDLLD